MGLNDIKFELGDGGLGALPDNLDHVSGILFENISIPIDWTQELRSFRSLAQAEAAGLVETDITYGEVHYQVKEYFRQRPDGELYVGFFTGLDKNKLFSQTEGRVRQWGVFGDIALGAAVQTLMTELYDLHAPAVACIGINKVLNQNALVDLYTKTYPQVDFLAAGDGAGTGEQIRNSLGLHYLASVGAWLGATAQAAVHESTAWVGKFNLSDGAELEVPRLATGNLLRDTLVAVQDELHDKAYTFLQKRVGRAGSFFNDNRTATIKTSDYSSISNNRTIQKAIRGVYDALVDELSAPVDIDPDNGQLTIGYIEYLKSKGENPLDQMETDGELSGFAVIINPEQNVLATSVVEVAIQIVPKGISRNILVKMSFASQIG